MFRLPYVSRQTDELQEVNLKREKKRSIVFEQCEKTFIILCVRSASSSVKGKVLQDFLT